MNKQEKIKSRPAKPVKPDASECCQSGCERCVFVCYEEALERWQNWSISKPVTKVVKPV